MTREELKNIVRHVFHFYDVNAENCNWTDMNEACGEILKILEQEPCEDCIARQPLIDNWNCCADMLMNEGDAEVVMGWIFDAPPVTPQPKIAQWVSKGDVYPAWRYCSKCKEPWTFDCGLPNYCPVCSAKMVESEA